MASNAGVDPANAVAFGAGVGRQVGNHLRGEVQELAEEIAEALGFDLDDHDPDAGDE